MPQNFSKFSPVTVESIVKNINSLLLPGKSGKIMLGKGSRLEFSDQYCTEPEKSYFEKPSFESFYDPDNWCQFPVEQGSSVTCQKLENLDSIVFYPDIYSIPCVGADISFQNGRFYWIDLGRTDFSIHLGSINEQTREVVDRKITIPNSDKGNSVVRFQGDSSRISFANGLAGEQWQLFDQSIGQFVCQHFSCREKMDSSSEDDVGKCPNNFQRNLQPVGNCCPVPKCGLLANVSLPENFNVDDFLVKIAESQVQGTLPRDKFSFVGKLSSLLVRNEATISIMRQGAKTGQISAFLHKPSTNQQNHRFEDKLFRILHEDLSISVISSTMSQLDEELIYNGDNSHAPLLAIALALGVALIVVVVLIILLVMFKDKIGHFSQFRFSRFGTQPSTDGAMEMTTTSTSQSQEVENAETTVASEVTAMEKVEDEGDNEGDVALPEPAEPTQEEEPPTEVLAAVTEEKKSKLSQLVAKAGNLVEEAASSVTSHIGPTYVHFDDGIDDDGDNEASEDNKRNDKEKVEKPVKEKIKKKKAKNKKKKTVSFANPIFGDNDQQQKRENLPQIPEE